MKTKLSIILLLLLTTTSCFKDKVEKEEVKISTGVIIVENEEKEENNEDLNILKDYKDGKLGNIVCKTQMEQEGGDIDSITYISGIRMSSVTKVTFAGKVSTSYMITDGVYSYSWGNGSAIKVKIDEEIDAEEVDEELKETDDMYNQLKQMPYSKCEKWKIDEDKFKLPEDQKFVDITDGFSIENMVDLVPTNPEASGEMPDLSELEDIMNNMQEIQ